MSNIIYLVYYWSESNGSSGDNGYSKPIMSVYDNLILLSEFVISELCEELKWNKETDSDYLTDIIELIIKYKGVCLEEDPWKFLVVEELILNDSKPMYQYEDCFEDSLKIREICHILENMRKDKLDKTI